MPISQATLIDYGARGAVTKRAVEEARALRKQTAFLCHSHHDAAIAKGLQAFLAAHGWQVYIDWEDTTMPSAPNRATAERIQERIRQLEFFFFLATQNSEASRWCPWELGYADGKKEYDNILIIPTRDSAGRNHGNEYLQLYRFIDEANGGGVGAFVPGGKGYLVEGMRRE
jgi:hypothetical protein